jgi:hypothetical protein
VLGGVAAGTVTVTLPEWVAPGATAGTDPPKRVAGALQPDRGRGSSALSTRLTPLPRLRTVSLVVKLVPRVLVVGGAETVSCTRSDLVTVTVAAGVATQLFACRSP